MLPTKQRITTARVSQQVHRMEATPTHPPKQSDSELCHVTGCPSDLELSLQPQCSGDVGISTRSKSTIFGSTMSNIAPLIHSYGRLVDKLLGLDVNTGPSINQTGACGDPLLDKLKQHDTAAPDYDGLGFSVGTPRFGTEEPNNTHPNLSIERQARMNLTNGEIHRLMPCDRKICFTVDVRSFLDANITKEHILRVILDGRKVAEVFTEHRLGITFKFAYTSTPGDEVFSIRCGRTLDGSILAQSFFPSSPPRDRQVLVSSNLMHSAYSSGHSGMMRQVLAHEFTHILGFRHWHAGSDHGERKKPSKLWPGTKDDDRNTIMCTPYHSLMDFHEQDFRVIREVYSVKNGHILDDCVVVDIDPDARRFIS